MSDRPRTAKLRMSYGDGWTQGLSMPSKSTRSRRIFYDYYIELDLSNMSQHPDQTYLSPAHQQLKADVQYKEDARESAIDYL
jgi:hypothetical protein